MSSHCQYEGGVWGALDYERRVPDVSINIRVGPNEEGDTVMAIHGLPGEVYGGAVVRLTPQQAEDLALHLHVASHRGRGRSEP